MNYKSNVKSVTPIIYNMITIPEKKGQLFKTLMKPSSTIYTAISLFDCCVSQLVRR